MPDAYEYTYFIVFKTDRTLPWDSAWSIKDGSSGFFHVEATLEKVRLGFGVGLTAKEVVLSYRVAWDKKTGAPTRESLTIDDVGYDKNGPRVFLCDVTMEKPVCTPREVALPALNVAQR